MAIPQLRKNGRQSPYVTIVDTGLLVAAQRVLAGLALEDDGITLADVGAERLLELANGLARELATRTF